MKATHRIIRGSVVEISGRDGLDDALYILCNVGNGLGFVNLSTGKRWLNDPMPFTTEVDRVAWIDVKHYFMKHPRVNKPPTLVRYAGHMKDYIFVLEDVLKFENEE